jgi:hypothetical protein
MSYRKLKIRLFVSLLFLITILISGYILIYQHQTALREREQELQELREQRQQQYDLQQEHLISIGGLVNNPKIHAFFTDLLRNNAEKFANSKNLDVSPLPLKFEGFYSDRVHEKMRDMGRCWREQKTAKISLNRLYLLNKFGHDKYFTSNPHSSNDFTYSFIDFAEMFNTCSHELAHYFQFIKHNRSSCRSDLILKNGNYDERLAKEHEK